MERKREIIFSRWCVALCITVLMLAMSTIAKAEETVFDKQLRKYKYKTGQLKKKKYTHKSKRYHKHRRRPFIIVVENNDYPHHSYRYNRYNRVRCNWYGCR
jgi:hypothetical protein